jgi:uncharacterized protein DUF6781
MADKRPSDSDSIRQAASESVQAGVDISRRVRDLTLEALRHRRFDREAIREVVRAVSEGVAVGAPASSLGVREALAEGLRGMDQALTRSVQAGHEALKQMVATGRGISENELKQGLAGLKKIEEDFIATVDQVSGSASARVAPELREVARQTLHAGTETGRQISSLMAEFTLTGVELAGEFGARFTQIASGMLAGMADALQDPKKSK